MTHENIKLTMGCNKSPANLATKNKDDYTILKNGDAFISQRELSRCLGVPHNTLGDFIRRSTDHLKLNENNQLHYESIDIPTGYFALDCKKPTKQAADFFKMLAKAGSKAFVYHQAGLSLGVMNTQQPTEPKMMTLKESLTLNLEQLEKIEKLENQAKIDAPKAETYDNISNADDLTSWNVTAKVLGMGRNNMLKELREKKVLMDAAWKGAEKHNVPYQKYIDGGYFQVKVKSYTEPETGTIYRSYTTFVTGKGLVWLEGLFVDQS